MPKRSRKFTRTLEKNSSSKELSPPPSAAISESDPVDLSASSVSSQAVASGTTAAAAAAFVTEETIRHHVTTKGASRYVSNFALKSNLKSSYQKLDDANLTVAKKDKQIRSLMKKNQELSDIVRSTRQSTRQATTISLAEVNQTQSELKKLLSIIDEKDAELLKQKQLFDSRLSSGIAAVVEKEKVCAFLIYTSLF